jgi:hypothetical protein
MKRLLYKIQGRREGDRKRKKIDKKSQKKSDGEGKKGE